MKAITWFLIRVLLAFPTYTLIALYVAHQPSHSALWNGLFCTVLFLCGSALYDRWRQRKVD